MVTLPSPFETDALRTRFSRQDSRRVAKSAQRFRGALAYDVKGNLVTRPASLQSPALSLVWDFDNKLMGADTNGTPASLEVTYEYDTLGRRVAWSGPGGNVVYFQAGQQTIADYPRGGAPASATYRYVYGSYIDEPLLRETVSGSVRHFFHRNQQYSITALTDSAGNTAERYAYTAYGALTVFNSSGIPQATSPLNNRYTYTGREWDDSTKLYHFRARWYDPAAGRFVGRDPLGFVDGMGLYVGYFAGLDLDPSGMLILFVGGIFHFNLDECAMYHRVFKECAGDQNGNHALIHIRYGRKNEEPPDFWSAGGIVGGTTSWVNDAGAKWLSKYVAWFQAERARLGSNEEIIIMGFSNGSNVIYKSVISHGLTADRIIFLGASADEEQCDWKEYRKKSQCITYNFWSPSDGVARWADGIGGQRCPSPEICNLKIDNCRHSLSRVAGEYESRRPVYSENSETRWPNKTPPETAWNCAYMCRTHYCELVDQQSDFLLSRSGRWVTPYMDEFGFEYWRERGALNFGRFVTPVFHPGGLPRTNQTGNRFPIN